MNRVLLDSDAYTGFASNDEKTLQIIRRADEILFSTVVLGELMLGFRGGSKFKTNMRDLDEFLSHPHVSVAEVTRTTADRFSRIGSSLKSKGRPIPTNDLWIAAQAMENGADLVSFDAHYANIEGLVWINPSE